MIETGKILQQRYRIDKQIGQGGMGAVYVATDERFGSTVAIKETLCMDDNYRKAIEREARLLNSLKHPALPSVSDHFVEENGQFLVMEYVPGDDLYEILEIRNKPFAVDQVLEWADQLLDALDFLHNQENPVIHRDIKPQNLKVAPGKITLLDFGLAKGNPTDAANKTAAKSIFGYSRNYASLEQIQGTGTDPRSDLYSLAATLYHLLTNTPPEDALTRAMAVLSRQPDPLIPANRIESSVPAGVAGILQNAMDLNSNLRPASAAEMRQMFGEYEKYGHYADVESAEPKPIDPAVFAQKTRLMPVATRAAADGQTDPATRVLPRAVSEVTSVRAARTTSVGGTRRLAFVSAGLGSVLLAAVAFGGLYVYEPAGAEQIGADVQFRNAVPPPPLPGDAAEEPAEIPDDDVVSNVAEPSRTAVPAAKSKEGPSRQRTAAARQPQRKNDAEEDIRIDENGVYMGNMKITEMGIETPSVVLGEHGPSVRKPNARPVPPMMYRHFKGLTKQQLEKLKVFRNSANSYVIAKPTTEPQ